MAFAPVWEPRMVPQQSDEYKEKCAHSILSEFHDIMSHYYDLPTDLSYEWKFMKEFCTDVIEAVDFMQSKLKR